MSPVTKRIDTHDAHEVIIENIKTLLAEKNIKQKDLAEHLGIEPSSISRWKSGETKINVDQLKAIALFFEVSVEQLINTEKERVAQAFPADKKEKPYIPQQILNVRVYDLVFKHPFLVLFVLLGFGIFNVVYAFSIQGHSDNLLYVLMASPVVAYIGIRYVIIVRKTYIINYLDDIFYRMEVTKNPHFVHTLILNAVGMLMYFINLILVVTHLQNLNITQEIYAVMILALLLGMMFSLPVFFSNKRKFKQEIYHHELDHYKDHLKLMVMSLFQLSFLFIYEVLGVPTTTVLWIMSAFIFALNTTAFYLVSLALSNYKLIYEEHGKGRAEMYPIKKS